MKYTVRITDEAKADLDAAFEWLAKRTPLHAPTWYNGVVDAILSLEDNPARCPVSDVSNDCNDETRQLLYGSKRHAYRILFTIHNDTVFVTKIEHAAKS